MRSAAVPLALVSPTSSISWFVSRRGTGSSKTRFTIAPVHLMSCYLACLSIEAATGPIRHIWTGHLLAQTLDRNRGLQFSAGIARCRDREPPPYVGHRAVSKRTAISSGVGASNIATVWPPRRTGLQEAHSLGNQAWTEGRREHRSAYHVRSSVAFRRARGRV